MLKYLNYEVTFAEIPDEISLCINITGCPIHCPGCHSKFLWEDSGEDLTIENLSKIIKENTGVSCICFMGGVQDVTYIIELGMYVKSNFPSLKIAWYSGGSIMPEGISSVFDYVKIGPYIEEYGGLNNPKTNQRLYRIDHDPEKDFIIDITSKFWKKLI